MRPNFDGIREPAARSALVVAVLACFASPPAAWAQPPADAAARAACHDVPGYRVVTRDRTEAVGSDIVVNPMGADARAAPCTLQVNDGGFEVEKDGSASFLAVAGHFLAVDAGTGPDRELHVYDLSSRTKVLDVPFDDDAFRAKPDGFTYWRLGGRVRGGACLARYRRRQGLPPGTTGHELIEGSFSVVDGLSHDTGRSSCTVTQDDLT